MEFFWKFWDRFTFPQACLIVIAMEIVATALYLYFTGMLDHFTPSGGYMRFFEARIVFWVCLLFALVFVLFPKVTYSEGKTKVNEDGSVTVTIPAESVEYCIKNGGCRLVSKNDFLNAIAQAIRENCGKTI